MIVRTPYGPCSCMRRALNRPRMDDVKLAAQSRPSSLTEHFGSIEIFISSKERVSGSKVAPPPHRRKPGFPGASSLLRYLFPQQTRAHLSKFRHEILPSLRHCVQSRIYHYILYRQSLRLRRKSGGILLLRQRSLSLLGQKYIKHDTSRKRYNMIQPRVSDGSLRSSTGGQDAGGQSRESGARRKKLASFLKSANELRQSYQQSYTSGWGSRDTRYEDVDDAPGAFPDAAVVRSGDEEMMLFPSYARKHIKMTVSIA